MVVYKSGAKSSNFWCDCPGKVFWPESAGLPANLN